MEYRSDQKARRTKRPALPVYECFYALFAETLDVQRDHPLGQRQEPPAGLQVTEGVGTGGDHNVTPLEEGARQQALGELERPEMGCEGAFAGEARPAHNNLV